MNWLPAILKEIAEAAGLEAALKLADAYGGTRRRIPAVAEEDGWLAECVGLEAAKKICDLYRQHGPGEQPFGFLVLIPMGPSGSRRAAYRRMMQALERGASAGDAALAAGVHERTVYRARRKLRQDDGQGDLF